MPYQRIVRIIALWTAGGLAVLAGLRPALAQDDVNWLYGQINALRASVGVHGYALNAQLSAAAAQHSAYMAATCDVSHTESNGSRPVDRARANGYNGSWISENIYGGTNARAADAWNFWINSSIHYSGLVNPNTNEVGIGVASGGCGHFFTLVFGYRPDVTAPPAPVEAAPVGEPGAAAVDQPPVPPTRYVPPPPSATPTPTIPTLTPSATWTITPTHTPSPTGTPAPPSATPLVLPTVPAPAQATALAWLSSPTAAALLAPTPLAPALSVTAVGQSEDGLTLRDLIPAALAAQVVLIVLAGFFYFRRAR